MCPCGVQIHLAEGKKYVSAAKKYCSEPCREEYGQKRQPDPSKYHTFNCQNCGKEVTRRKSFNHGSAKYCSNPCAQRHTKKKYHIVLRDDDVLLDSSWEAFFWGACRTAKIPIERFDRQYGVQWGTDGWYAPDFWLPSYRLAVETKGLRDPDDRLKWVRYRAIKGGLWVIEKDITAICPGNLSRFIELQLRDETR